MTKRSYRPEQIINKLREAEVLLSQGSTIGEAARKIGVTDVTYYRWRREYGGMRIDEVKRLKELEKENTLLKKLVANLSLDVALLKEASRGTVERCLHPPHLFSNHLDKLPNGLVFFKRHLTFIWYAKPT